MLLTWIASSSNTASRYEHFDEYLDAVLDDEAKLLLLVTSIRDEASLLTIEQFNMEMSRIVVDLDSTSEVFSPADHSYD